MQMNATRRRSPIPSPGRARYVAPDDSKSVSFRDLLRSSGKGALTSRQLEFLGEGRGVDDVRLFYAGDLGLISRKCISIVGTREASSDGLARASRLARELVDAGVVVVSGLARGIDTSAHLSAIESSGQTVAVIGTSLTKAYPAENARLQEQIWRNHLLITPFHEGQTVYRSNFPIRNRVMAAVSDATVIVEASDTSGTLHQAAECQRLGRWLFIMRKVAEDRSLTWPARFLNQDRVAMLSSTDDIISRIA
jgi:DNA protecting protein DprA